MTNVSNRGSITNFTCKLSSDLINEIRNGFRGYQRLDMALKRVESYDFLSRKIFGKDTDMNLILY